MPKGWWLISWGDIQSFFKGEKPWIKIYYVFGLLFAVIFFLDFGQTPPPKEIVHTERELQITSILKDEFYLLPPMPDAIYSPLKVNYGRSRNTSVSVSSSFETTQDFATVYQYYTSLMEKKGWSKIRDNNYSDSIAVTYKKDNYELTLGKNEKSTMYISFHYGFPSSIEHPHPPMSDLEVKKLIAAIVIIVLLTWKISVSIGSRKKIKAED